MPGKSTSQRADKARKQGKAPSTQAGEFIRNEIEEIRAGEHGARSAKQAIAIGLSKARRAGVKLPPPKKGTVSDTTRKKAMREAKKGQSHKSIKVSRKRSLAATKALKREGHAAASPSALSRHARAAAKQRTFAERSTSARKAARTRAARHQ